MKSFAYHEAGHVVAALHMGFDVEYTTIEQDVSPLWATKTVRLKDFFDEDALMFGRLERKGKKSLTREDYKIFYSILIQKLAGYIAVELASELSGELAEVGGTDELSAHFNEDRAFALNTLNHLEREAADKKFKRIEGITTKLLKHRWEEVESLSRRLQEERTVYFSKN